MPGANPVLDPYRDAVARGAPPTNRDLEEAFAAFADPKERSMYSRSRSEVIAEFGFGLSTAEVVAKISAHGPILEIGAGSGLWSFFLKKSGCDVVAVDLGSDQYEAGLGIGRYHSVVRMDAVEAMRAYPDRSVLMVWPDRINDVAERVADEMEVRQTLLHMGETIVGCTGTDGFRERIKDAFDVLEKEAPPVWNGLSDHLKVFSKERECGISPPGWK